MEKVVNGEDLYPSIRTPQLTVFGRE